MRAAAVVSHISGTVMEVADIELSAVNEVGFMSTTKFSVAVMMGSIW